MLLAVSSLRPMLSTVSIMPGMENLAPDRQETSSGLSGSPKFLPVCLFQGVHGRDFLIPHAGREVAIKFQIGVAGFGGDGEAGRNGHAEAGHSARLAPLPPSNERARSQPLGPLMS